MIYFAIAVWLLFAFAVCLGLHNWSRQMEAYDAACNKQ